MMMVLEYLFAYGVTDENDSPPFADDVANSIFLSANTGIWLTLQPIRTSEIRDQRSEIRDPISDL